MSTIAVGLRIASTTQKELDLSKEAAAITFGTDVKWDGDFHITGNGDLEVVSGVEAFRLRFERALVTRPGELLLWPSWGIGIVDLLNRDADVALFTELKRRIESFLLAEPYVSAVGQIQISMTGSLLEVLVPMSLGGRNESVSVTIRRA